MVRDEAKEWIKKLNKRGYAGYHDWRLPTVEEAASLLESRKKNGDLYIDPVFSKNQMWILTGDKFELQDGSVTTWLVSFWQDAHVHRHYSNVLRDTYVRPVRSMK